MRVGQKLLVCAISALAMIGAEISTGQVGMALATPREQTIIDTLGVDPTVTFSVSGASGETITVEQSIGPRFTLDRRTRITEIGAFITDCLLSREGCADTPAFIVQIRPEKDGLPDPNVVIASFALSRNTDPFAFKYEFVRPHFRPLAAGTYFAIFATPRDADAGALLGTANSGAYVAGRIDLGFITPQGAADAGLVPAAVRILGVPLGRPS